MAEEIYPSLYRIVVPLPGSPLKEINSYVLTSNDQRQSDRGGDPSICTSLIRTSPMTHEHVKLLGIDRNQWHGNGAHHERRVPEAETGAVSPP